MRNPKTQGGSEMTHVCLLESFDSPAAAVEATGPSLEWVAGHVVGFAEGRAAAAAEQGRFSAEIVQSLADLSFSYAEARGHLLLSLRPLFTVLMDRFLPGLVREGLAAHLAYLLRQAAVQDLQVPIDLCVHPDHIAGLRDIIGQAGMPLNLRGDRTLSHGQAQLSSVEGETMLDLDELLSATREALAAIFFTDEKEVHHG